MIIIKENGRILSNMGQVKIIYQMEISIKDNIIWVFLKDWDSICGPIIKYMKDNFTKE